MSSLVLLLAAVSAQGPLGERLEDGPLSTSAPGLVLPAPARSPPVDQRLARGGAVNDEQMDAWWAEEGAALLAAARGTAAGPSGLPPAALRLGPSAVDFHVNLTETTR